MASVCFSEQQQQCRKSTSLFRCGAGRILLAFRMLGGLGPSLTKKCEGVFAVCPEMSVAKVSVAGVCAVTLLK